MRIVGHLVKTAFHAFFHLFVTAFFCSSVAAVAVLVVAYGATREWPPRHLTMVALIAISALATYAGVVTALLVEVLRGVFKTIEAVDHELVGVAHAAEHEPGPRQTRSRAS